MIPEKMMVVALQIFELLELAYMSR